MAMNTVFTVGPRHFIVMLQDVPAIPDHVGFTGYYEATCELVLADGQTSLSECVVRRERDRRNVVGLLLKDRLVLTLVTGLTGEQLTYAAIGITRYGHEIGEPEAILRIDRKNWDIGRGSVAP